MLRKQICVMTVLMSLFWLCSSSFAISVDFPDSLNETADIENVVPIPMSLEYWLKDTCGNWEQTADGIKIYGAGYRIGNTIRPRIQYNMADSELFIKYRVNGNGTYTGLGCGIMNAIGEGGTTEWSFGGSTVFSINTWYYTRIRMHPDKSYQIVTATGNYDINGGTIFKSSSGAVSNETWPYVENAIIYAGIGDNYGGAGTFMEIGQVSFSAQEILLQESATYDFEGGVIPSEFSVVNGQWIIDSTGYQSGESLYSGSVGKIKIEVTNAVAVSFYSKVVSNTNYCGSTLFIDNAVGLWLGASYSDCWIEKKMNIPTTGTHTITWKIDQNSYCGTPAKVWIDNIKIWKAGLSENRTISGSVKTVSSVAIPEVSIIFSNSGGTATTDASGNYSITVPNNYSGIATPSKAGYTFSPTSRTYNNVTSNQNSQDYQADQAAITVTPTNQSVAKDAGTTTFSVSNTGAGTMSWTAAVTAGGSWLNITSGTSGSNAGAITCAFGANTSTSARTGTIRVTATGATGSPKDVTVTQAGTPEQPVLSVTPGSQNVAKEAGTTIFSVSNTGTGTMPWTAAVTSGGSWLNITSGTSGSNSGTITCSFSANTTSSIRTATIRITAGGATGSPVDVTVGQMPTPPPIPSQPVVSVNPANQEVAKEAGTTTFGVSNTGAGTMSWTAAVTAGGSWLSITSGASGSNSGTITCSYSANTTFSTRAGTIRITADGATGSPVDVTVTQSGSFDISLTGPGWNLISIPRQPSNTATSSVLAAISGKYSSAWAFQNGSWKVFDPAYPGFSDLTTLETGWGYWLNMTEPATFSVTGTEPSKTMNLIAGWNLVGFNSSTSLNITSALASIAGKVISVWAYKNNSWQFYDPAIPGFSDLTTMAPGYGYWINTNGACTWTLTSGLEPPPTPPGALAK